MNKARDLRIEMSKQFDYSKHPRMLFLSKNKGINRLHLSVTFQFASSSSINGLDVTKECESMSLIHRHWIHGAM